MENRPTIDLGSAGSRLLVAIGYPANAGGIAVALEIMEVFLAALVARFALPRMIEWLEVVREMRSKAQDASLVDARLGMLSSATTAYPTYRHFANARMLPHDSTGAERLNVATGAVVFYSIQQHSTIPDSIASALTRLRGRIRSSRALSQWTRLARAFPLHDDEFEAVLPHIKQPELRNLLAFVRRALQASVVEPAHELVQDANDAHGNRPADTRRSQRSPPAEHDGSRSAADSHEPERKLSKRRGKLVQVLLNRGIHASTRDRLGATSVWNRLPPDALAAKVREVLSRFDSQIALAQSYAALAICCLLSGLSAQFTVRLPLISNDDLWLDLDSGQLLWNYRLAIRSDDGPSPARGDYERIPIRMDVRALRYLRHQRVDRPNAAILGDLLCVPSGQGARPWLVGYRDSIRSSSEHPHQSLDARFARSLGLTYLHVTKSDVWPALLALDFSYISLGTLHYISVDDALLREQEEHVARFLGFQLEPPAC